MYFSISCRFLGHLSSREVGEKLAKDLPNHQTAIVKAWFRCVLHIPASSQLLTEVTRYTSCLVSSWLNVLVNNSSVMSEWSLSFLGVNLYGCKNLVLMFCQVLSLKKTPHKTG